MVGKGAAVACLPGCGLSFLGLGCKSFGTGPAALVHRLVGFAGGWPHCWDWCVLVRRVQVVCELARVAYTPLGQCRQRIGMPRQWNGMPCCFIVVER